MDVFTTNQLLGVVEGLKVANPALLAKYFGRVVTEESEEIHFDVILDKRRVAPFVHPLVEGQIVESLGYQTKTFKPAYVKDKRRFDPSKPLKRIAGEQIGGSLSPQQRLDALLGTELQDQVEMISRRLEVMASEALRTGKVTVVGEKYPSAVVDFGRAGALTPTALAGGAKWDQTTSTPLDDLQTWSDLVLKESGAAPVDVIMGVTAWKNFRKHASVEKRLDLRNLQGATMNLGAQTAEGLSLRGTIDGFNIFTYGGWYVDPATGTETPIWPADIVGMTSSLVEGVRAFGAILDPKAPGGLTAVPFAPKMWIDDDPPVTWLMMQSAPLVVPTRVNASLGVDVV